ncbi:unnamed protein product [Lepeophtheirus salmonis]|uniref:(salmon louse) hypothetical protein n=1 Tax=Lepeophtheirus salmonis TaxID=72036 RepID=A0A7R8D0C5_LEPSM|nr:unnamed protein product [Lepeophtheirus salmonis]CAF2982840.1 unnamed protein product [Lepeophtheirus salmonis]
MDNFFTSPRLVRLLKENGIAATGTLRANRTENAPLIANDEIKKGSRGISNVVNDNKYNVTLVRWKDNKVVTVASTLYGKEPMKRASRYMKDNGGRVYRDQPNDISVYNRHMGGVDKLDQNISNYMINLRNKKWWWPLFCFCGDISINNAYQLYRLQPHNQGQKQLDLLGFRIEIVEVYYKRFQSENTIPFILPSSRSILKVVIDIRYVRTDHWIAKVNLRPCVQ